MSIARDGSLPIKVLKDLNHLCPCDSIDMQVLTDLKRCIISIDMQMLTDLKRCFLGGVFILPPALSSSSVSIDAHDARPLS